jgi:LuxR family transcriptional regulator, maltose regulon positive regulatory protein
MADLQPVNPASSEAPGGARRGSTSTERASQRARSVRFGLPRRPPDNLPRTQLVDFLHENSHRKLILLSAAAGYGKSSLLADYAHETDQKVAWLRLDDSDRDLVALVADMLGALQERLGAWPSLLPSLAAQAGTQPAELGRVLAREMAESLDAYFVLVIDDFHLVDSVPAVIEFFDALLEHLPEHAHLIMAGRTLPSLRFSRLVAQQQVAGLSEEHLRFKPEEVQALLQLRNRPVPASEAESLVAHTEGWITGILLTTHLMWQGLMAGLIEARPGHGPLFDYLAEEVLERQPGPLRQFLLESAVLPEMEPGVCDAVLDRRDSAAMLRQAESRRLFVSVVGDEQRAYQYHHLFRDFLQDRLGAEAPARLTELLARAADWFAGNGMPEAAVTYAVRAGRLAQAVALAEAHAKDMFTAGRHATLRRWAEQLAGASEQAPRLFLFLASADSESGDVRSAQRELDIAAAGYARRDDASGLLQVDLRRCWILYRTGQHQHALELAEATTARAAELDAAAAQAGALRYGALCRMSLGQMPEAERDLAQAARLLQDSEHQYDLATTLADLANLYRLNGQTTLAARTQQQALAIMRQLAMMGPLAAALNNIAWDLHMLGQYDNALATYTEALEWARRSGSTYAEMTILAGQADLMADLRDRDQASRLYRQALARAQQLGDRATQAYVECAQARLDRAAGNYISALEWLRRAEATYPAHANGSLPLLNVDGLRGATLAEMGRLAEGVQMLQRVAGGLEANGSLIDLAQTLLLGACAELRAGQPETAARSLGRALQVAEKVGYDQMLLSEVPRARDLLEAFSAHAELGPQVSALLARAEAVWQARARLVERGLIAAEPAPAAAAAPPPSGLRVRALGEAQVIKDGAELNRADWGTHRARELFFFLVDRMPVARDTVLQTFWPDKTAPRALSNLYQSLYRLRRGLGSELVTLEDQVVQPAPGVCLVYDAAQFEHQAQSALGLERQDLRRLGALQSAALLYTGDFLADLPVDWAAERRRALAELHLRVLANYADELLNLTRYGEAREVLARALAADPMRDDLHSRMLLCLAALGRRHEVVDHYRRYREMLRSELGLDPPNEVRALYARLIQ